MLGRVSPVSRPPSAVTTARAWVIGMSACGPATGRAARRRRARSRGGPRRRPRRPSAPRPRRASARRRGAGRGCARPGRGCTSSRCCPRPRRSAAGPARPARPPRSGRTGWPGRAAGSRRRRPARRGGPARPGRRPRRPSPRSGRPSGSPASRTSAGTSSRWARSSSSSRSPVSGVRSTCEACSAKACSVASRSWSWPAEVSSAWLIACASGIRVRGQVEVEPAAAELPGGAGELAERRRQQPGHHVADHRGEQRRPAGPGSPASRGRCRPARRSRRRTGVSVSVPSPASTVVSIASSPPSS